MDGGRVHIKESQSHEPERKREHLVRVENEYSCLLTTPRLINRLPHKKQPLESVTDLTGKLWGHSSQSCNILHCHLKKIRKQQILETFCLFVEAFHQNLQW